ncbi:MAG TPA: DUF6377 domain-containing protein [Hanamia sp.]
MAKVFIFFLLFFGKVIVVYSAPANDSLFSMLKNIIGEASKYDAQKIAAIDQLKISLKALDKNDLPEQYKTIGSLYEEYKRFNYDSAFLYARKLQQVSYQVQRPALIEDSKVKLSFILVSAGLFKDAFDTLHSVSLSGVSDSLKAEYYSLMGRYYYDLSDYNNDKYFTPAYYKLGNLYIDSSLLYYQPSSFEYDYYKGLKDLKTGGGNKAVPEFLNILKRPNLSFHQKALVESTLSGIYREMNETDKETETFLLAAIDDIISSTKETTATLYLSQIYFAQGNLKAAFLCVEKAIQDAVYYGARQRQVQVSSILPIIEGAQVNAVVAQKKLLILYSSIATLLLLGLIVLFIIINKQNKKLKIAQQAITKANQKEQDINQKLSIANSKLSEVNSKLSEANKIKEEYIIQFFNVNADFFSRIEKFKTVTEKKLYNHKYDDIKYLLNNINLKAEKAEMLKNFDKVFLNLFPDFINDFNSLFKESERIYPDKDELLNTDLRIFALMKMGITNNEKIAQILGYSVNTIYAYKTKIKKKSIVSSAVFDEVYHINNS